MARDTYTWTGTIKLSVAGFNRLIALTAAKPGPKLKSTVRRQRIQQPKPTQFTVSLMNEDGSSYGTRDVFALSGQLAAEEYVRLYALMGAACSDTIDVMVTDPTGSQIFTVKVSISAKLR